MRHGAIILPEHTAATARKLWSQVERLGFDHAWTYDHLAWRWLQREPWFGSVPTLLLAATVTSRIGLGTMVASPTIRHPVTLAKDLATLDDVSDGRAICGVGAGAAGIDEQLMGVGSLPPRERMVRFAEFVELIDLSLRSREVDYSGRYYTSQGSMFPGCRQQPRLPIAVAATGPAGMRIAARHAEIWVTAGVPGWRDPIRFDRAIATLRRQLAALEEACAEVGRDPATLRRLVVTGAMISGVTDSVGSYHEASGALGRAGLTDLVVHWPRADFPYRGRLDVLERFASDRMSRRDAND